LFIVLTPRAPTSRSPGIQNDGHSTHFVQQRMVLNKQPGIDQVQLGGEPRDEIIKIPEKGNQIIFVNIEFPIGVNTFTHASPNDESTLFAAVNQMPDIR
jgi:hypothetical protein